MSTSIQFKFKNSVSHYLIFAVDKLKTRAAADGFREEYLNPTNRPRNLVAGASDKNINERKKRQSLWDSINQKFIKAIQDFTDGTEFEKLVKTFLQNAQPHEALDSIRQFIFTKASKKPKILVDEFFATHTIPDNSDPEVDRIYAVDLIRTAALALSQIPLPNNHILSEEEKGYYLRSLLTPLSRFSQIFSAGQVNANEFDDMNIELQAAIASIAKNKAYGELSARQSKAQHAENEVDHANAAHLSTISNTTKEPSFNSQQGSQTRSNTWNNHNKSYNANNRNHSSQNSRSSNSNHRYRSPTPGPQSHRSDRFKNYSGSQDRSSNNNSNRRSYSRDRYHRRSSSNDSYRSNNSYYNGQRSPHHRHDRNRSNSNDRHHQSRNSDRNHNDYHYSRYNDNNRYDNNNYRSHQYSSNYPPTNFHAHAAQSAHPTQNFPQQFSPHIPAYAPPSISQTPPNYTTPSALSASTSHMFGNPPDSK
jgi:hypothetical protein